MNRADFIVEAIESVLSQDYPAIEHIIIDGGSTDGTLEILKRYPHLRVISEPDRGLYDAINKGIQLSRGEIVGLLNTDDCYAPNVFSQLAECFQESSDTLSVCGAASYFINRGQREETIRWLAPITDKNLPERLTTGIPAINSCMFRTSVFDRIGYFDLTYRLAADRDFLLRFACARLPLVSLEDAVYRYRYHPGSLTIYDVWKPLILNENLQLAALYSEQNANIPIRKACLRWENIYTMEIIGHFSRKRDFGSAQKYYRRTCRRHWWWPVYFMGAFPVTVVKYLGSKKNYGKRSVTQIG